MFQLERCLCVEYMGKTDDFWLQAQTALNDGLSVLGVPDGMQRLRRQLVTRQDTASGLHILKALQQAVAATQGTCADLFALAALAWLLPAALEVHRNLGADEAQLKATFHDTMRWADWFYKHNGRPGLDELHWAVLPYAGQLFQIGSLQYQPFKSTFSVYGWAAGSRLLLMAVDGVTVDEFGYACLEPQQAAFVTRYQLQGDAICGHLVDPATGRIAPVPSTLMQDEFKLVLAPGQNVVNLHIPAGADLDAAAVDDSLRRARTFLNNAGLKSSPIVCHSWMLNPDLKNFLPPGSRILLLAGRFARLFVPGEGSIARFVFSTDRPLDALTADDVKTSLQKKVHAHLTAGNAMHDFGGVLLL